MRALRTICFTVVFYSISAIPFDEYSHDNIPNAPSIEHDTLRKHEVESLKSLHDAATTIVSRDRRDSLMDLVAVPYPLSTRHGKHRRRRRCKNRPMCPLIVTPTRRFSSRNYDDANESNNTYLSPTVKHVKGILVAKEHTVSSSTPFENVDTKQSTIAEVTLNNTFQDKRRNQRMLKQNTDADTSELINKKSYTSTEYVEDGKIPSNVESKTLSKDNEKSILLDASKFETDIYDENDFEDADVSSWSSTRSSTNEMIMDKSDRANIYDTSLSFISSLDSHFPFHGNLATLLTRLFQTLRNVSAEDSRDILKELNFIANTDEDPCQKWLNSWDKFEQAFLGSLVGLPACPCEYPSNIFYDDKIWDEEQQKYFRWRDVSGESQRLDIYKPGAAYCVRSLLTQGSRSAAAQHCCYDHNRLILTRGSGAGTPNFISPEISVLLHERIDVLPWRLCKGDFSRFNKVRPPNNDNSCETNPDDEEYQRQIDYTKYY